MFYFFFFFQAEDGIRDVERSRGLGDVYKRQETHKVNPDEGNSAAEAKAKQEARLFLDDLLKRTEGEARIELIHQLRQKQSQQYLLIRMLEAQSKLQPLSLIHI
eukprot:TRINITY_DN12501_c0_g1_i3.p3 TRINITY_DN12501_c0_g1~~TRINITY_DN12501_c0_g1_i3.p3  ORF type:complete len:104 (-),score=35.60 TRINITY_DN12501_c0_g1_i3:120-431(-)